jgi:Flp pilus assembly protein TadG
VAPWFFMLVFGMLEFGRAVMVQQIITNASREGARIGVLDGSTTSQVTTTVGDYLTSAGITGADVTVNPNPPSLAGYGEPVTVSVAIPFGQVSWVPLPKIPWTNIDLKTKTLTATTVMRRETIQ